MEYGEKSEAVPSTGLEKDVEDMERCVKGVTRIVVVALSPSLSRVIITRFGHFADAGPTLSPVLSTRV